MQQIGNDKGAGTLTTHYHYDAGGRLIGENDAGGGNRSEYVYLGAIPVAVIRNGQAYMIHTDHLDTPRRVTDQNTAPVWDWRNADPFGATPPDETAGGSAFVFNLRFPGQYFDKETGLAYNVFRDYDPGTGRYIESDPIGLAAGQMSTYAYVNGNPLNKVDPLGLFGCPPGTIEVPAPGNERNFPQIALCKPDSSEDPSKKICPQGECAADLPPVPPEDPCVKQCPADPLMKPTCFAYGQAARMSLGIPGWIISGACSLADRYQCIQQCHNKKPESCSANQ